MATAVSADGTVIGYESAGAGPGLGQSGSAAWRSRRRPLGGSVLHCGFDLVAGFFVDVFPVFECALQDWFRDPLK